MAPKTIWLTHVSALLLPFMASIQAQSESKLFEEQAYESNRLSRLPFEAALPSNVVRESSEEPHSPGDSAMAAPAEARIVTFLDAVQQTAASPALPYVQSHIQGELVGEDVSGEAVSRDLRPEKPLTSPSDPSDQDVFPSRAPGDSVAEFDGLANSGWIPPDTVMAIGPTHVVEAVNSGFAVYNKSGTQLQGYTSFATFFGPVLPLGWDGFLFDPRVIYSAEHSRFVLLVLGKDDTNQDSFLFLAFPQTGDPTGTWWIYAFDHQNTPSTDTDSWADYCGLGADTWGVYVTCNVFYWVGGFKYALESRHRRFHGRND